MSPYFRIRDALINLRKEAWIYRGNGKLHDLCLEAEHELAAVPAADSGSHGEPLPMLLHCPMCNHRHIDEGEFATKHHHTHACQHCGHVWRPAIVPTVGVQFLPGFKDEEPAQSQTTAESHNRNLDDKLTQEDVRKLILTRIMNTYVDHNTLWRLCGSPQGTASYYFDVELGKLCGEGRLCRMSGSNGMLYARGALK